MALLHIHMGVGESKWYSMWVLERKKEKWWYYWYKQCYPMTIYTRNTWYTGSYKEITNGHLLMSFWNTRSSFKVVFDLLNIIKTLQFIYLISWQTLTRDRVWLASNITTVSWNGSNLDEWFVLHSPIDLLKFTKWHGVFVVGTHY